MAIHFLTFQFMKQFPSLHVNGFISFKSFYQVFITFSHGANGSYSVWIFSDRVNSALILEILLTYNLFQQIAFSFAT